MTRKHLYWPGLFVLLLSLSWLPGVRATEQTKTTQNLLTNASALNAAANVGAANMPQCRETAIYVVWSAGTSAGVVTVESSYDQAYTGTWAPLATVTWSAVSKQDIVQITGIHLNLRTRISTAITGGTVSTILTCN